MVLPSLADVLLIIVILIPGFISFGLVKRIGVFNKPLPEFEVTIWSFVFSTIILFLFIIMTGLNDIDKIREQFFYPRNFGLIFGLAVMVGLAAGFILKRFRVTRTFEDSWEFAMKKYFLFYAKNDKKDELVVSVVTRDNRIYRGIIDHATDTTGGDLILNGPTRAEHEEYEIGINEVEVGEILLIKGDNISRVIFHGDIMSQDNKSAFGK